MGELSITDGLKMDTLPTYTCGHCSDIVVMRPDRKRERTRCMKCGHLLCEKKELCRVECTPLRALALDHFEGPQAHKYGRLVPAIMAGALTEEEGLKRGLILSP